MTREEMLQMLHTIPFALIDPAREWSDIGFTERDIWVNAKGYGWISCDEPTTWCEVRCPELDKWISIREKLSMGTLSVEDVNETGLVDLLREITYGDFDEDVDNPCDYLQDLLYLPDKELQWIYGMDTIEGWQFFATEEDFKKAYERDWCHVTWEELSDAMLAEWIERLSDEEALYSSFTVICSPDDFDIDFQKFVKSLDASYLSYFVKNSELEVYIEEACEQLKEHIINEEADVFYDRLWDLYAAGEANGNFSYSEVYSDFISKTQTNIRQKYANAVVQLFVHDVNGAVKASCNVSIADILLALLEGETEGREFDAKVGQYIETSLIKFVDSSIWHLGYRCQDGTYVEIHNKAEFDAILEKDCPVIWFGPDGNTPIDKWLITHENDSGFGLDHSELLHHLVDDCDDCFEIWYLAECGYWLPDMEEILKGCPIEISAADTVERINQMFYDYFNIVH